LRSYLTSWDLTRLVSALPAAQISGL
jgi:hypothetical protein